MKWLITLSIAQLGFLYSNAQQLQPEVLAANGGQAIAGNVQLEWTLGETAINGYSDGSRNYTEGFHQPMLRIKKVYDPSTTGAHHDNASVIPVELFPNPASEEITLLLPGTNEPEILVIIHDARGHKVTSYTIESQVPEVQLDIAALFPGLYFISVTAAGQPLRSIFKMTKI